MSAAPGFRIDGYLKLRAAILAQPDRFRWSSPVRGDHQCIACFCADMAGSGCDMGMIQDIEDAIGCSFEDAAALYHCEPEHFGLPLSRDQWHGHTVAILCLDACAAKYGVTPESAPAPAPSLETQVRDDADVAASGKAGLVAPIAVGLLSTDVREPGGESGASSRFIPNERAFVAALQADADQFAAEVRKELETR